MSRLEEEADEILRKDREDYLAKHEIGHLDGSVFGILSFDQLKLRQEREISMSPETFDAGLKPGLYRRTWYSKPSRPTKSTQFSLRDDPWFQYQHEYTDNHVLTAWLPLASRRPMVVTGGTHYEGFFHRDPLWPIDPRQGRYHHLTNGQRSRIRAELRSYRPIRLRRVMRQIIAERYGVPVIVILRVEVQPHQ